MEACMRYGYEVIRLCSDCYNSNMRIVILLLLLSVFHAEVVPLHRHVIQEVFQENKPYLIYVHGSVHNFQVESIFNGYCFGEKLCAVLEPNIEEYDAILQYVGTGLEEYFLIFDPNNKRKYVLPVTAAPFTQNDLLTFEYKAIHREIDPYFASEDVPSEADPRCSKLVGRSVGQFLRRAERMKVIFLYAPSRQCPTCEEVLAKFVAFAGEHYSENEVVFGYINTLTNDHPVIHDEKTPNILIFIDKNYQNPFELAADSLDYLKTFIDKTLNRRQKREVEAKAEHVHGDL